MIAELHCHTSEHSSCSHVNAVELIKRAFNLEMQAIVITDHHYQWNDIDLKEIKKRAGVDDIFNVLSGQESHTSDYGDILVYGAKKTIEKQNITLKEIREKILKQLLYGLILIVIIKYLKKKNYLILCWMELRFLIQIIRLLKQPEH
jgi:predicted metal-dependent phosphoesterase TrpH